MVPRRGCRAQAEVADFRTRLPQCRISPYPGEVVTGSQARICAKTSAANPKFAQ
jgi:hypothetical protein